MKKVSFFLQVADLCDFAKEHSMCLEVVQGDLEELVEEEPPLHLTTGRALTWTRYHNRHFLVT